MSFESLSEIGDYQLLGFSPENEFLPHEFHPQVISGEKHLLLAGRELGDAVCLILGSKVEEKVHELFHSHLINMIPLHFKSERFLVVDDNVSRFRSLN